MEIGRSLYNNLKYLCSILNKTEIKYCLIGGLAVSILAKPRATEDIDLLMLIDAHSMNTVRDLLKQHFQVIQDDNLIHFKNCTIWRIVIKDTLTNDNGFIIIDIVFADRDIYKNAVLDTIQLQIDDTVILLAKPENLIEIKKLSGRPVDLLDIQALQEAEKGYHNGNELHGGVIHSCR